MSDTAYKVELTAEEVRRAIARAACEKANAQGRPYKWGSHVEVFGLSGEASVRASFHDQTECHIMLWRRE